MIGPCPHCYGPGEPGACATGGRHRRSLRSLTLPARQGYTCSTCQYSSSTGTGRPSTVSSTRTAPLASSTSLLEPLDLDAALDGLLDRLLAAALHLDDVPLLVVGLRLGRRLRGVGGRGRLRGRRGLLRAGRRFRRVVGRGRFRHIDGGGGWVA